MHPERWQRLEALFDAALALPSEARESFLARECGDDAELRAELTELLAAHDEGGVLDRPRPALVDRVLVDRALAHDPLVDERLTEAPTVAETSAPPTPALPAGARLGPYEVVALLGAGGMGEVYRARDPRLGREVAIKRLRGGDPRSSERGAEIGAEALRRFDREARAASALNHPNLLVVYDVGVADGEPYIVTELLEGETLRERLRGGPISAGKALRLARQIASGLAAAHDKGIVHRDLKPENLFLTADDRVKILDFGLAKRLPSPAVAESVAQPSLTGAGLIVGTLGYTAPEQLRGQPPQPRSDLFSLGAVLYEMLSLRRAFPGTTAIEAVAAVLTVEPPPFAPGVAAPGIEQLVRRCLAKRPEERFASARELLAAIDEALAERAATARQMTPPRLTVAVARPSLAVLPFLNLTGDPEQEYFCEGIAEELLHALGSLPGLRVAARSSSFRFHGEEDAVRRLGKELRVDAVLEGSVRRSGERLRIAVQLVGAADSCHLWSARYDLAQGEVFAVQEEIATRIASALSVRLAEGLPAIARPATLDAYHLYLKGRYHWNKRHAGGLRDGVRAFEQALEQDPLYARAWAGLADSYALLGIALYDVMATGDAMPRAKVAAAKALAIDPTLPEPHAALGWVRFHHDWDWAAAERDFRRALELGPEIATTRHWYSFFLSAMGRAEEAQEQARRAWKLDPLSPIVNANVAQQAFYARRFDEAAAASRKLVELEPAFAVGHYNLALALAAQGRYDEALPAVRAFGGYFGPTTRTQGLAGYCLGKGGRMDEARAELAALKSIAAERDVPAHHFALVHVGLGNRQAALSALESAAREGSDALAYLAADPFLDSLRPEPRFQELLRRVGLAEVAAALRPSSSAS